MLEDTIGRARSAVQATVESYLGQAAVYGLAAVAGGFTVAAVFIALVQEFGAVVACLIVAGMFVLASIITRSFASSAEERSETETEQLGAEAQATADAAANSIKQAISDPRMLMTMLPAAMSLGRLLGRNMLLLAVIVAVALMYIGRPSEPDRAPLTPAD